MAIRLLLALLTTLLFFVSLFAAVFWQIARTPRFPVPVALYVDVENVEQITEQSVWNETTGQLQAVMKQSIRKQTSRPVSGRPVESSCRLVDAAPCPVRPDP